MPTLTHEEVKNFCRTLHGRHTIWASKVEGKKITFLHTDELTEKVKDRLEYDVNLAVGLVYDVVFEKMDGPTTRCPS